MPPYIDHDTEVGLTAWGNYKNGGTWNTVVRADPENIANSIEQSLTWWPPGQYLPLGLLYSAGLSVGMAAIAIAFLSTLSLGAGGALLVKELSQESDICILPWVSAALASSHYALINFHHFWGGETGLMAVLPWIVLAAYKLRHRTLALILFLPPLFLLGSFIKHAFAIHSFCILAFLWLEKSREELSLSDKKITTLKKTLKIVAPLFAVGLLYLGLRHYFIETTVTPLRLGEPLFGFTTYLGYSAWAPLMAPWGIGSLADRFAPRLFELNGTRIWEHIGLALSILSPLAIGFYTWLSFRKSPLISLTGLAALLTALIHLYIYHSGGVIELRDRYYQFPAFLFLAVVATYIYQIGWKMRTARLLLGLCILIGSVNVVKSGFASKRWIPINYRMGVASFVPDSVIEDIHTLLSEAPDSVLVIPHPSLDVNLSLYPLSSTRILATYGESRELPMPKSLHGRSPLIVIASPKRDILGAKSAASRFADYSADEWESHESGGWLFLKTKQPLTH
ncbi:hypothetical protein [Cephaloticoccus capnophilus]|uniref:hypothetical protein n=1 Tax=Cephaloticoccus capnophilus TaxID=1548208 RepID=UPI0012E7F699|nr:hypothetical protein [Cephaloticoccus capnophilus]